MDEQTKTLHPTEWLDINRRQILMHARLGKTAEAIVDTIGLSHCGRECTDRAEAVSWVECYIDESLADGSLVRPRPAARPCYGCNRPLDPHAGLSVAYCGQCGQCGEVGR
jgi:hypothetical protein